MTMPERRRIETDKAPPSTGFRSQGLIAHGLLFVAGQIGAPLLPSGEVRGPAATLAEQVDLGLGHLAQVTGAAGGSLDQVVEFSAFPTVPNGEATIRDRLFTFLGYEPPLVHIEQVTDVALHALIEVDWIVNLDPSRSLIEACKLVEPSGGPAEIAVNDHFIFLNGLTASGETLGAQTTAVLNEATRLLHAAGSGLQHLVKLTVYIADFASYPQFNDATKVAFADVMPPARSVLVAPEVTGDRLLKLDVLALAPESGE